jgi:ABC-type glutathione transport system ATPase component
MSNVLDVKNLDVTYPAKGFGKTGFKALNDINIHVGQGETLGLVGESGSGKTTLGRAILGLAPVTAGSIDFLGKEISHASRRERRDLSRDLQVVFQDPYTSLNPSMEIGQILAEPLQIQGLDGAAATKRIAELLDQVGLPGDALHRLPREFSGGQRQRVAIARALALSPKLIVCDEPVSALDLTTQARILDLFLQIQKDTGVSYLFVSHDLDVVRHISHRVAVMYKGEIVEQGPASQVTVNPTHPYTQRLLMASPVPDPDRQAKRREDRKALLASQAKLANA